MEGNLVEFLSQYRWLTDSYLIEFFIQEHWNKLPAKWRDVLDTATLQEVFGMLLRRERCMKTVYRVYPLSMLAFVSCARALAYPRQPQPSESHLGVNNEADVMVSTVSGCCNIKTSRAPPALAAQTKGLDHAFRHCIKPKKQHEIRLLGQVIFELAEKTGCRNVIDIGAGQGHLARYLAYYYGLNVTTIEAAGCHLTTATKLDGFAEHHLKCKKKSSKQDIAYGSIRHINAMVHANFSPDDLLTFVSDGKDTKESYILVGLHTCGDLGPAMLRLFTHSRHIAGIVSVGCCYMKLSCEKLTGLQTLSTTMTSWCTASCVNTKNRDAATAQPQEGYPLSQSVKTLPNHSLSYEAREVACHAIEAYFKRVEDRSENLKIHCHRALVEMILRNHGLVRGQLRMSRAASRLPFTDYAKAVLQSVGVPFSTADIEKLQPLATTWWEKVTIFFILRLLLAPCIESLLLLDRVLYLQEQGYDAKIAPLFEPKISPRNLVITAYKTLQDNSYNNSQTHLFNQT